jgi:hypothetical protein
MMQAEGVRSDQVSQVRGFADQQLRLPQSPEDPSNRRISLIVQYLVQDETEVAPADFVKRLGTGATDKPIEFIPGIGTPIQSTPGQAAEQQPSSTQR